MPFLSKAQERWGHSAAGLKALGGKKKVAEWDSSTPKGLPERLGKTRAKKSEDRLGRAMKKISKR